VHGPTSGLAPGAGASATGLLRRSGWPLSAALNVKAGIVRQAIMGTYVLHERTFSCQVNGNYLLLCRAMFHDLSKKTATSK
jgi:hypothetical protein